jgi:cell division protein FtsN
MVEFTVQVASYPTAEAAKSHANELVKKGFPAFPVEAVVNGRSWYRVSVGSFKSQKEATAYRTTLLKQADLQSAIVQKISR